MGHLDLLAEVRVFVAERGGSVVKRLKLVSCVGHIVSVSVSSLTSFDSHALLSVATCAMTVACLSS